MHADLFHLHDFPEALRGLATLATDLRWTWSHGADGLWERLNPIAWKKTQNPYVVLQNTSQERLQDLADNEGFVSQLNDLLTARQEYLDQPGWYPQNFGENGPKGIAYFSMEFGLGEALPLYAGGLGVLAGDYLKAASDLDAPVVGIGLLYQEGYFRQSLDHAGWQQETYHYNDPTSIPVRPVLGDDGAWMHVSTYFPKRKVRFRVWQAQIGKISLYLLDSNDPMNLPGDRGITSKLYGGGQEMRLMQEIALGICGWQLLEKLGLDIDICHLNEGHAGFATLERARSYMKSHSCDFWQALWATRAGNVFTTHTPVAAGFDRYETRLLLKYCRVYAEDLGVDTLELGALGWEGQGGLDQPFNMAYLAMRTCALANGVSALHGEVTRRLFGPLFPRWPSSEVPVGHVTNGIHVPSWDSTWSDGQWTQVAGKDRWRGNIAGIGMSLLENTSDEDLWTLKGRERADLVEYARERLEWQRKIRNGKEYSDSTEVLDPNVLTLGFARRFATYKRPDLLLWDMARFARILNNADRPVQIIVAGKAHPADEKGKGFIQHWIEFLQRPSLRAHVLFLEDYDIALAQQLVQGVDVWVNTPRRPWEACGTSGMKVLVNGGLNLSCLDGWWDEAYEPDLGWAIGSGKDYAGPESDEADALELYRLLEDEIVPLFYDRDAHGVPRGWVTKMRASMSRLTPQFSTNRMLRDYIENLYQPASGLLSNRSDGTAVQLLDWCTHVKQHWHQIHFGDWSVTKQGSEWEFQVPVYLGEIMPDQIRVMLYADADGKAQALSLPMQRGEAIKGSVHGFTYRLSLDAERPSEDFTPRVEPYHPDAQIPMELPLIHWYQGKK